MKYVEEKYSQIRAMLAEMSKVAQSMMEDSIKALLRGDKELAKNVKKRDGIVDRFDNDIEDVCFKVLAMYDPKAFDLRFVMSALRIIVDLERIGDSSVNIAKQVKHIDSSCTQNFSSKINEMATAAKGMLEASIEAFFKNDTPLALETIKKDDYIDKLNKQIITDIINYISLNPQHVKSGVSLVYIARNIERIADHATNICEFVYFKKTGKSIRHTYFDKINENKEDG